MDTFRISSLGPGAGVIQDSAMLHSGKSIFREGRLRRPVCRLSRSGGFSERWVDICLYYSAGFGVRCSVFGVRCSPGPATSVGSAGVQCSVLGALLREAILSAMQHRAFCASDEVPIEGGTACHHDDRRQDGKREKEIVKPAIELLVLPKSSEWFFPGGSTPATATLPLG